MLGTTKFLAIVPQWGDDRKNIGTCTRLMAMKANMARSHFWKLPVAMIATSATAAMGTETYSETPA